MSQPVESPPVSSDDYRGVMRYWPSGVTILTMPGAAGHHGMTASAFTSVSVDPPMILVVVDQRWRSHGFIDRSGVFCVNILPEDLRDRSDRFAGRHGDAGDRFHDVPLKASATGCAIMEDATGFLDCEVAHRYPAGDHTIFVGRVVACGVFRPEAAPLIYFDQNYRTLAPDG